jgi:hypothetical protein
MQYPEIDRSSTSGVAGGVVQSKYFQIKFGIRPVEGSPDQSRIDDVSANVVSVLQGGAFFGALGSAPISGGSRFFLLLSKFYSSCCCNEHDP